MSTNVSFLSSPVFQSGCKTKTSFCFSQEKLEIFLKLFFSPHLFVFLASLSRNFPCFAGCKCKKLFLFPQAFFNLFFFRNLLSSNTIKLPECLRAFFAVAGAKVEPFSAFPMLSADFFRSFFKLFLNSLVTAGLHFGYFQECVGFFFLIMPFRHFLRAAAFRF